MRIEQHEERPRWVLGLALSAGVLLIGLLVGASPMGARALERLEHGALDALFRWREDVAPSAADERIVLLVVDQHGLDLFEHASLLGLPGPFPPEPWPWPRESHASAVDFLAAAGAKAVFFDFLFTGHSVQQLLMGGDDDVFAAACATAGNVYQPLLFLDPRDERGSASIRLGPDAELAERLLERFPAAALEQAQLAIDPGPWGDFDSLLVPLPELGRSARGLGAVNSLVDPDGVLRRVRLLYEFRGSTYPSIHLALARGIAAESEPSFDGDGLRLGETVVPIDEAGALLLNWHGGAKSYAYAPLHKIVLSQRQLADPERYGMSAAEARAAAFDAEVFRDKIVLVGSIAAGLADLHANPFDASYPGIEVHATALDNLLNADFVRRPAPATRFLASALLLLVAGQLLLRRQSALLATTTVLALGVGYVAMAAALFLAATTWIDVVAPTGGLVLVFAGAQTLQYVTEGRQKRQVRSAFQRYLPAAVVDEVLQVPLDQLRLGGDRKELTVYFSDLVGFTSISEALEPEELVRLLNRYLSEMTEILGRRQATVDKFIGDCVMAFWGAPLDVEDGPTEACLAAIDCQERLAQLRGELEAEGLPALYARVGINTGAMLVGNMGSEERFSYTVMGDAVNLASRLEGANKQFGSGIMIGARTFELAQGAIEARELDRVRVKGRDEPETVYELLGRRGELSEVRLQAREKYVRGLAAFRSREWESAHALFGEALALVPDDGPSRTYRERCLRYRRNPPPENWDGVYDLKTK